MQVACPHCQARYAFNAAEVPEDGYDARCHACGKNFFVAGAAPAPAAHRGPPRPATAAPPLGSARAMAEALAAEGERFAHEHEASAPGRRPSLSSLFEGDLHADAPAPADDPLEAQGGDDAALHEGLRPPLAAAGPRSARAPHSVAAPARQRTSRPWAEVAERPEQAEEPRHRTRARLGFVVGMVCTALVTLGVVVGVVRSKQLHLPTQVPPPLHIVRDPPPEAVAAFERGMAALRRDNVSDYEGAKQAFADARALDGDYTDAWAAEALTCLLRAEDARAQADAARAELAEQSAQLSALAEAQGSRAQVLTPQDEGETDDAERDGDAHHALEVASAALRLRTLARAQSALQQRFDAAARLARRNEVQAASLLLHAQQLLGQTPLLATTVSLWLAADPAGRAQAPQQLKVAEQLGAQAVQQPRRNWGDPPEMPAVTAPYAAWRMLVRAELLVAEGAKDRTSPADGVVAAYEAALRLDGGLRRARWLLADYLAGHGRPAEAEFHLRQLVQLEPRHERAAQLLSRLGSAHAATAPSEAAPAQP